MDLKKLHLVGLPLSYFSPSFKDVFVQVNLRWLIWHQYFKFYCDDSRPQPKFGEDNVFIGVLFVNGGLSWSLVPGLFRGYP